MCNCGKKRQGYSPVQSHEAGSNRNIGTAQDRWPDNVHFEYTGLKALSVTGNISGRHYRFIQHGSVQPVDYRDAPGMMSVPVLRRVNKQ